MSLCPPPPNARRTSRANGRAFAPALKALVTPSRPTILDNGATVSRAFLDAAEAADHADQIDGGRDLRIVIVAKAEDLQSATSAEASLMRARVIYPNARIILAVTHVRFDRQRSTHNAGPVVSAVEASGKADGIVLVPLLNSPFMGELYGEQHIPFHLLASLPVADLAGLIGDVDEQEVRIYRGQYPDLVQHGPGAPCDRLGAPCPARAHRKGTAPPFGGWGARIAAAEAEWAAASRAVADRLLAGDPSEIVARVIAPAATLWDALLPADRERVVRWARPARTGTQSPAPAAAPRAPKAGQSPAPLDNTNPSTRLVSAMQAERRRSALVRSWRDTGLLVGIALAGAAVAVYVQPPLTRSLTWGIAAWLAGVVVLARHAVRRARGRGIMGTPERNMEYHADPERFALGGVLRVGLGAGLGVAAMLAALVATGL